MRSLFHIRITNYMNHFSVFFLIHVFFIVLLHTHHTRVYFYFFVFYCIFFFNVCCCWNTTVSPLLDNNTNSILFYSVFFYSLHQQKTTSPMRSAAPCSSQSQLSAGFGRKFQACLGCYLTTCRQKASPESDWGSTFSYRPSPVCPPHLKRLFPDWADMSAGGQATRSREIPAVRRVAIHDSAHMPQDYSTTPGGTVFSTTPGGNRCCRLLNTTSCNN